MYRDKSLIPTEAIRMLALGILNGGEKRYADLAAEVRHFATHVMGPSLDIMGTSLELLRYEGLAEAVEGKGLEDNAFLAITEAGRRELHNLLCSNVRAPMDDLNKLVVALKMRFLHVLEPGEQRAQIDMLIDMCNAELARLEDLRSHHADEAGHLGAWLAHDIGQLESRVSWLTELRDTL